MSNRTLRALVIASSTAIVSSIVVSCGSSSAGSSSSATPSAPTAAAETEATPAEPGAAPAATAPSAAAAPERVRVRYDLAAHLERVELRQGDAQVVDFGVPAGSMYTLGGWRTRVGRDRVEGDVTASVIENVTGFVLVPSDVAGPRTLRIRARAVRDGRVTVYVDGETIGYATLPTDGTWGMIEVALPAERLRVGENSVQLRVSRTGSLPGVPSAGLLLDWMRLGPADDAHASEGPPVQLARGEGEARALAIPDGWTAGWTMEVPEAARLRGIARGTGRIEVIAHRDGEAPRTMGTVEASADGRPFDLDLAAVGANIARLDLRATGDVTLTRPAVVTLDARPLRSASDERRPRLRNVLVYLTDTLRADKLRPYRAQTRVRTPALDAWVQNAALMLRGHSQENWTKPSVATLLSGLYPWEHNATTEDAIIPSSVQLLSERLRESEYYSGAFVANGFCSDRFGFEQGWNTFRNYIREGLRSQSQFVAADVLQWLDRRPQDQPFFLYVHTIDPHVPYMPPAEALAMYDPNPYSGIVDFGRDRELLEGIKIGRIRLNARDRERLEALYDGEITYHDTHFGSIIQALEARGIADETIVVFTADHGEEFWDHDSVGHGHSVFEELINVPLILRIPGVTDGAVTIEDSVGLVDVLPTIFDALGMPIPSDLSGESFLPQLLGASADAPRFTVTGFMDGWRAINVGRLKLIHRTERRIMLYDLVADPDETRDLAADHPIAVRYARGLLGLGLSGATRPPERRRSAPVRQERIEIDATTRAQLEALGYAGASRPQAPPED
ncbi:sulfatase-like hydrolase/transferase [Sandaracinus amylolyticus]|uniref:Choline-sulfatase n=1 Tax=Sandaracinus amylolyticus TaxID=927083 RepID=A0A0F6W578_9BACT|nr:sulfatase-like hydrolase/transferase [Sandaracinus amylolyticus]AKF07793.1 Choline-sulfatase [Sandaracinus amylolyticus]